MDDGGTNSLISFAVGSETIRVRDELEEQELEFRVVTQDEEIRIQPALTDLFIFPVDNAVTVTATELHVDVLTGTAVWNGDGEQLGNFTSSWWEFPTGTYFVQILGSVTTYLRIVDTSFSGIYRYRDPDNGPLTITFPEPTEVTIGARSLHTRPQATITVPDEPGALLEALPYLGSSIKEFSCERSWPTLRGHPPAMESGDHLEIPNELSKPETGVTITVPPTYADLYRVSPLVFYMGADLEEGDQPALHLENGYVELLETSSQSLEERVDEILGQCLLLDTLTRIDGYLSYKPRYEYEELAPHLPFYPPNLYGASLSDQLMEYLEVPFELLDPYVPEWPLTTVLRPHITDVECLPHALDVLSRIRVRDSSSLFDGRQRASGCTLHESKPLPSQATCYSEPNPPAETCYLLSTAFENGFSRSVPDRSDAQFAFVNQSTDRADEVRTILDTWGPNTGLEPDTVTVVERPTKDDLERVLETEYDFLFCDLPTSDTESGFECVDGSLPLTEIGTVGAKTVAVREAGRMTVGIECIKRGAVGGAVLEETLPPKDVVRLMELLVRGCPLLESLRFADVDEISGWRIMGDPIRPTVRGDGGQVMARIDIESIDTDEHELVIRPQPTDVHRIGSVGRYRKAYARDSSHLIGLPVRQPQRIPTAEVVELLEDTDHVVRLNGEVYCGETDAEEFTRASVRRTLFRPSRSESHEREMDQNR